LSAALDLTGAAREALFSGARTARGGGVDELTRVGLPLPLTAIVGRKAVCKERHVWAARILGARDAVAESTGASIVDSGVNHVRLMAEHKARTVLGAEGWTRAYATGRTASIDSLLTDIETMES